MTNTAFCCYNLLKEVKNMSENICRFIPKGQSDKDLRVVDFVYETQKNIIDRPFFRSVFRICIVTGGSAALECAGREFALKKGCVFFTFPDNSKKIKSESGFRYMYISFTGARAIQILRDKGISEDFPVFYGLDYLIDFWWGAMMQSNRQSDSLLCESVLLYTLSQIKVGMRDQSGKSELSKTLISIKNYVDTHYHEPDIALSKVASVFSYNEKYLSTAFKKQVGVGFNAYLKDLRLRRAKELFDLGIDSISEVANLCGFADPAYFSKQFKAFSGKTPAAYIKKSKNDK